MYCGIEIKWLNAAKTCGITRSGKCFVKRYNRNGTDIPMLVGVVINQKFEPRNDRSFAKGGDWESIYAPKRQQMVYCLQKHKLINQE